MNAALVDIADTKTEFSSVADEIEGYSLLEPADVKQEIVEPAEIKVT